MAHTIVALCPCRFGEEFRFLKIVKSRSCEVGKKVFVLKKSTENGLFFHFHCKMNEEEALPLPVQKRTAHIAIPAIENETPETATTLANQNILEEASAIEKTSDSSKKHKKKVTHSILLRMKQLYDAGTIQGDIAKILHLSRKTVNQYLQRIKEGEYEVVLSTCQQGF